LWASALPDVKRIDATTFSGPRFGQWRRPWHSFSVVPKIAAVDGNRAPTLNCACRDYRQGDARCLSIAAASIIAKVTRDRIMVGLGAKHPGYGFERHKGYGTVEHHDAIKRLGVTPHHRRSFRAVQLALGLVLEDS